MSFKKDDFYAARLCFHSDGDARHRAAACAADQARAHGRRRIVSVRAPGAEPLRGAHEAGRDRRFPRFRATKRTRTRIKAVKRKERPLPARTKRCPVRFLLQSLNLHLAYLKKLLKCQLIQMSLLIVYAKMFHGVK